MSDGSLHVDGVTIAYGRHGQVIEAVRDVRFAVQDGEFAVLVGPSGCGKTTLLHAIGGLLPISGGTMYCGGHAVSGPGPERVMIFQEQSLFRWRSVRRNIEFALECKGVPEQARGAIIDRLLRQIGLEHRADVYPFQLSGGMKQRVAIARALAYDAEVLLMDEPFGALDAQTRLSMQSLLLDIWQQSRKTVLFVTHDIDEAIYLADRVLIMSAGPGTIVGDLRIDAPRPRTDEFLVSHEFVDLKREILNAIRGRGTSRQPAAEAVT